MIIRAYRAHDLPKLFSYWRKTGTHIPYFFPVSAQKWQMCLLQDQLEGEPTFRSLATWLAAENGRILGFIQVGHPTHAWRGNGEKYHDPNLGVIRQLYFDQERYEVGEALLATANDHLAPYNQKFAFYHILGMSCTAHHGKLHQSQSHVDTLLQAHNFQVEHQNVYYVLDINHTAPVEKRQLDFACVPELNEERFEIRSDTELLGTAQIRYLETLTGGQTRDTAYLSWIGIAQEHRGRGIGTYFLTRLTQFLASKQIRYLHTDTAGNNLPAQQLYQKVGFGHAGMTRSYIQS